MAKLVTTAYGEALFELSVEQNMIDVISQEIDVMQEIFKANDDLIKFLNHPKVNKEDKISVIENSFKGKLTEEVIGFLVIIMQKGRFNEIDGIFEYFTARVKEHKNISIAYVCSAIELNEVQKKNVEAKLLGLTNSVQIEMNYSVDKSLIGGMVIRIGDRIVDNSIKNKLNNLTKQLSNIQLA